MLQKIRRLLLKIIDNIDAGNSNISTEEAIEVAKILSSYTDKDITPDEAFSKWKTNYMNSLKEYVKSLKPINQEVKESTFDTSLDFDEFYKELIYEMVD